MDFFYPSDLPITAHLGDISELIQQNQVTIIAGDTGSGKTTQLPKICLGLLNSSTKLVGCTQPRRIAATSVCERVKEEMGSQANLVGSKIRFRDHTTKDTRIKFMTDGLLLAETRNDPLLKKYDVIIVDEAHERSLNIDFLLGYLHRLLAKRVELKLVITSATIDTELFSKHFDNAPILQIKGRTYPVDMVYSPVHDEHEDIGFVEHCIQVIEQICNHYPPGDILVFLPTERDIRSCCEILQGKFSDRTILPLFGRLQSTDQRRIFKHYHHAKIVVSSNVAETSVTVPGIRYVVDTGLARIASYDHGSRTTRLPVTKISQASCNQRAGRCGRIAPGICFRLYDEDDFSQRQEFTVPEIQRSNLAEVILQMVALNLGDPHDFPFLEAPKPSAIHEGFRLLRELNGIDERKQLTETGKMMARLPIDPVVSRIIIEAQKNSSLKEIIIIASALALQDPRVRPAEKEHQADKAHKKFSHPQSDFIALLNIWHAYHDQYKTFSWGSLKRFCTDHFLSFQRMREWLDLHDQLQRILKKHKSFKYNDSEPSYENIHRSLLSGLFRHSARKKKGSIYQGVANNELMIFPGSYQYLHSGDWIIAGSFLETSRLYGLTIATIEPEWIELAAKPFCSYSWTNARWQKKSGRVIGDEQVALQGLILISGRVVNFGRINKKNIPQARTIFIQKALVENLIGRSFEFLKKNNGLIKKWQESEHKLRRKNIVIDEISIFDYYHARLPDTIYDRYTLVRYLKKNGSLELEMSLDDILLQTPEENALLNFPSTLLHGDIPIRLTYCFEPGNPSDGVTAHIPDYLVDYLKKERFDWLVPGLIVEKTTFLLKGLPKKIRKQLIPVSTTVERLLDSLEYGQGNYLKALNSAIFKFFKVNVQQNDWPRQLPDHLQMRFSLVDVNENELTAGRNLKELLDDFQTNPLEQKNVYQRKNDELLMARLQQSYFKRWDFTGIPQRISCYTGKNKVAGYLYAALQACPEKQAVTIKYFDSLKAAENTALTGTLYLLQLHFKEPFRQLKKYCRVALTGPSTLWLTTSFGGTEKAQLKLLHYVMHSLFGSDFSGIIPIKQYDALVATLRQQDFYSQGKQILDEIIKLLRQRREVYELIKKFEHLSAKNSQNRKLFTDLHLHLDSVMPAGFLDSTAVEEFEHVNRYLKSLAVRTERGYANPLKDSQKCLKLAVHLENLEKFNQEDSSDDCRECYQAYRFMVYELRVSVFSPEIRTTVAVSEKKLRALLRELQMSC